MEILASCGGEALGAFGIWDSLVEKPIFQGFEGMSKIKLILNAFWHRFRDDLRGPGNVKNEEKRGRVALFLLFGVCKIRCRFGAVLDWSGGGFWNLLARFWLNSEALNRIRSLELLF